VNKNLGTAFGSYIEPSGDEAIELCKDSGLSAKPVGYVYQETDSFTGHKHLVGAIDKQTLAVGTPLYAHPPTVQAKHVATAAHSQRHGQIEFTGSEALTELLGRFGSDRLVHLYAAPADHTCPACNPAQPQPCTWTEDAEGYYSTECGETYVFNEGTPAQNNAYFCHHCGGKIIMREQL